jgi:hypothetical protein
MKTTTHRSTGVVRLVTQRNSSPMPETVSQGRSGNSQTWGLHQLSPKDAPCSGWLVTRRSPWGAHNTLNALALLEAVGGSRAAALIWIMLP